MSLWVLYKNQTRICKYNIYRETFVYVWSDFTIYFWTSSPLPRKLLIFLGNFFSQLVHKYIFNYKVQCTKPWSSAVDRWFEPQSDQTKDYKIGICFFSVKHTALRRKSKDWLTRNQNNLSDWSDMSAQGLLFQWASTIKIQFSMLV